LPNEPNNEFRRTVGLLDLILFGVGGIVGTGVFVLTGRAAALNAGPAITLSFVLGGVAALLAAMCYAEAAGALPVAGGAYAYSRAAMGDVAGWIVGWDLLLEYFVGNAVIGVGWAAYAQSFIENAFGVALSPTWSRAPYVWDAAHGGMVATGGYVNLPAVVALLGVTWVVRAGLKNTTRFNFGLVAFKLAVIFMFIAFAAPFIRPEHWQPFIPANTGTFGEFGWSGVMKGTGLVFFSYVGFDALVTAGQELHDPQRSLPKAIFASLAICTLLYVATAVVLTGVVAYPELAVANPLSYAARRVCPAWLPNLIEVGAMAGLASSMAMGVTAQPRIVYAMAQDGLLPKVFAHVDKRRNAPVLATTVCGVVCALIAGFVPIGVLNELVSVGTLFGFGSVSLSVIILRRRPHTSGSFRFPGGPYLVPLTSVVLCAVLIASGGATAIVRVLAWMAIGLILYFLMHRKRRLR
jgi:APA family basic amino acid/polyamine antiporter